MKRKILFLSAMFLLLLAIMLVIPNFVSASTVDTDALIKKIAPDGENAIFYMKEPTTMEECDFAISGYIANILAGEDYNVFGFYYPEEGICSINITSLDYSSYSSWDDEVGGLVEHKTGWKKDYELNVKFVEPTSNSTISGYINKLNDFDPMDPSTYYIIDDLSLINYYITSDKSELWNPGAPGRALKYSTLNNLTNGSNTTYYLEVRAGNQDETLMFESAFGPMSIFYNGYSYGTKEEGVYLRRVIYIPESTENTTDAYVKAAQKRINDYLGDSTSAVVSYGGTLSSLPEFSEDEDYPVTSDGNYYNIKIGTRTYKFYIVKASSDKLVEPIYLGTDIASKIEITSEDSSIPLDTSLTVKNVTDSSIKDKIGTENYKSYDISLYSDAKNAKIEKIENGKFLVKIPVPSELNGKELVVYYITSTGEKEEHEVTVKDGYAEFTTDHFSVYTLAEKVTVAETTTETTQEAVTDTTSKGEKDETPKTGVIDIINYVFALTFISTVSIVVLKKKI